MEQSIPFQVPSEMTAVFFQTAGSENDPKAGLLVPSVNLSADRIHSEDAKRAVIFLDIDGVLNRSNRKAHSDSHVVATDLLARLKSLVSSTDAFVVLASTWRHEPDGVQKARELGIPFEDVLPDLRPCSRGREVRMWLASHPHAECFAIIDDDDDEYENMALFQPNPYQGLSDEVAAAVEDYIGGRRKDDYRRSLLIRAFEHLKSYFGGHRG
jgi:hypothetical protein